MSRQQDTGGVFVDVGEPSLFYVELEDVESYTMLYSSKSAVLMRTRTYSGEELVLRVSWSKYKRIAYGKGYIGMDICADIPFAPLLFSRQLNRIGDTYVGVIVRQYMPGVPLSNVWSMMGDDERNVIKRDVRRASELIARHTSKYFMELQGSNLSTQDPVQYINYRILLSKLTRDLREGDITPLSMDPFDCVPALSHQDLSLGHIIIREGRLSGIVGWGRCDYAPEIADRLKYYFVHPYYDGEKDWYEFVSRMPFVYPAPPPLYSITCMYYHYSLRKNVMPPEYIHYLDDMMRVVSDSLIQQARPAPLYDTPHHGVFEDDEVGSDQRSQDLHTEPKDTGCDIESNPFRDEEDSYCTTSDTRSSSRCTSWDDDSTVIGILDALSVA